MASRWTPEDEKRVQRHPKRYNVIMLVLGIALICSSVGSDNLNEHILIFRFICGIALVVFTLWNLYRLSKPKK